MKFSNYLIQLKPDNTLTNAGITFIAKGKDDLSYIYSVSTNGKYALGVNFVFEEAKVDGDKGDDKKDD